MELRTAEDWTAYWFRHRQPWRREPEISQSRQRALQAALRKKPNPLAGDYPLKGWKLSRADVEWLLANHENGRGPVTWDDPLEHGRQGLDLRGADLSNTDLSDLPLARLRAGLSGPEWRLVRDHDESLLPLAGVNFAGAKLTHASLQGSSMTYANLAGTRLNEAHLEGADLFAATFAGGTAGNLHGAYFDSSTKLYGLRLSDGCGVAPRLFDVRWGDTALTGIDWPDIKIVFDEYRADRYREFSTAGSAEKQRVDRNTWYLEAAITYRQLAAVLKAQGLGEEANKFAFRAEKVYTKWLRHSNHPLRYAFWMSLGLISGWGYRLWRSAAVYSATILAFAVSFWLASAREGRRLSLDESIVMSAVAFHGRGYSPGEPFGLGGWLSRAAAGEAFIGLFVEAVLVATLTRRLFGS